MRMDAAGGEDEITRPFCPDQRVSGAVWLVIDTGGGPAPLGVPLEPGEEVELAGPRGRIAGAASRVVWATDAPSREGARAGVVHVADLAVSARHCRVVHRGETLEVTDLGSRNGVRVSGIRVPRAELGLGAAFEIGRSTVRVEPFGGSSPTYERPLRGLVGGSRAMRSLAASVRRIAHLRLPVLLRGESGTGKDLVARAIHEESARAGGPFIALNAATISRELAESELFGHRRGAFTGAIRDRRGAFREAHGGTLFLDEIAAIPLDVQPKLLRVVEEGVIRPLGAESMAPVDVRLVVATCDPLEEMLAERRFRADLYERLAVCVIHVPPLAERLEDIPALAHHLLRVSELGARELSAGAVATLRAQHWSGNVRELRNVIVQAAVHASGPGPVQADHVAKVLADRSRGKKRRIQPADALRIFEDVGRNVSAAARRAELPRSSMRDLLRAAGVCTPKAG